MTLPAYAMNVASFPQLYERVLVDGLFRPWVDELFERVGLKAHDRVLDVACGTGIVARLARERCGPTARIVGVDVSAPMLAVASEMAPSIDWRQGDAHALPITGDEKFDVVLCQQGLQFFADKQAALREMRRVLAPDGRVGIAVWLGLEAQPLFRDLYEVAEKRLGPVNDARLGFGDREALRRLLLAAGFRDVDAVERRRLVHVRDAATFLRLNTNALIGMSTVGKRLGDDARAHLAAVIDRESAAVLQRYRDGAGLSFELATNIATAKL